MENAQPAWIAGSGWTVDTAPALEIGADTNDPRGQLFRVQHVVRINSGNILIANASDELAMFDSTGRFQRLVGRAGEGPGEFTRLSDVYLCADDTLAVNDFSRMSFFTATGEFVRTVPIDPDEGGEIFRVGAVQSNCSTFLASRRHYVVPPSGQIARPATTLAWRSLDGTIDDTIATIRGTEVTHGIVSEAEAAMILPWATDTYWTVAGDRLYVASSDSAEVKVYDSSGALNRIVRWQDQGQPVTAADRNARAARHARWLERYPTLDEILLDLNHFPSVPTTKPLFLTILVDGDGNIWVRKYPSSVDGEPWVYDFRGNFYESGLYDDAETWMVFDASGRQLGPVETPGDLAILTITTEYVIGVWQDDLDVQRVRLHRILKADDIQ